MEAQTLLDYNASTSFINKELVRQYKLALMKKNTPQYEKKGFLATRLATQFLSCNDHFQLAIFLHHEC
jgi:hypothetical protein